MRHIRIFRSFLAVVFFAAAAAFLFIGESSHPMAIISEKTQIILSALSITLGATLVWLLITFLLGRVYCSTVCPMGAISDFFARLGRKLRKEKPYTWRPASRWPVIILPIYVICLVLGLVGVPFLIEPWNMMRNIASVVNPEAINTTWINFGFSAATGIIAGIVSFILIVGWSLLSGRPFCNTFCPIGCALGAISGKAIMHIEIDRDKCIFCGNCEAVCASRCINTLESAVDNTRCLKCFDCLAACEHDAIRYRISRNVPLTPLFRKHRSPSP